MESPYKQHLEALQDVPVVIHRAHGTDAKGVVTKCDDNGVHLGSESEHADATLLTFIAYQDIRGVAHEDWDDDIVG